jgi:hypothetical protein
MNPTYIIYLLTFLGFPILGLVISRYLDIEKSKKYLKWTLLFFAIHNILYLLGISINGDYPDYFIFSLEYLFLSLNVSLLYKATSIYLKTFRIIGKVILVIGFLQGLIGIVMFIVVSQDYETDKIYTFKSSNHDYQTRRYSFGFTTLADTRYTFETYRKYNYLPLERLINKTDLFELNSDLNFRDDNFIVNVVDSSNKRTLEFTSTNGKTFRTTVD